MSKIPESLLIRAGLGLAGINPNPSTQARQHNMDRTQTNYILDHFQDPNAINIYQGDRVQIVPHSRPSI